MRLAGSRLSNKTIIEGKTSLSRLRPTARPPRKRLPIPPENAKGGLAALRANPSRQDCVPKGFAKVVRSLERALNGSTRAPA